MLRFCYYIKAVFTVNIFQEVLQNGKMRILRKGRILWYCSFSLSQTFQPHLEAQCEARQGHRKRFSQARLRLHSLHAQRQGHPRIIIA